MERNRVPTLAETIAAGSRLLAGAGVAEEPRRVREEPPAVAIPQQATTSTPDEVWRGAAEIARLVGCGPWTVAEHLRTGTLHGHADTGDWAVRDAVVEAFRAGADPAAQQRLCGCGVLRLVHDARRRPGRAAPSRRGVDPNRRPGLARTDCSGAVT